jgi:UDP-N-acetylmuramate dehydrogenase
LVSDAGIGGLTVLNLADGVRVREGGEVRAEAGAQMATLAQITIEEGLVGLEWAAGLPGTVGGAIVGNAGAFGGDVASVLTSATVLTPAGEVVERRGEWFEFEYRGSRLKRCAQDQRHVVLDGVFGLRPGDQQALKERMGEIVRWRRERHPSGATMGSTFENPPGEHAGHLIEQAGLKGYRVGGVKVSEQHANFLINTGGATAADVLNLIRHVQDVVEDQVGIRLQLEVELLGEWSADDLEGARGSSNG